MPTHSIQVARAEAGKPLAGLLRARLRLEWKEVEGLVKARKVFLDGQPIHNPQRRMRPGQKVTVRVESRRAKGEKKPPVDEGEKARRQQQLEAAGLSMDSVVYVDAHVVVVNKPAGLTAMRHPEEAAEFGKRAQRFLPPTLADLLPALLPKGKRGRMPKLRAVHRLDKDTSGLIVFARTPEAEGHLGKQFRAHSLERSYMALVRGRALPGRVESYLVPDRGDGRRGSGPKEQGKKAVTEIRVVEDLGDFTLVECHLESGRTHQIRIHLGERGTPLCGERIYDRPLHGQPLPDSSGAGRVMLHAGRLGFVHPATGKAWHWHAPLPGDMLTLVMKLRHQSRRRQQRRGRLQAVEEEHEQADHPEHPEDDARRDPEG